MLFTVNGLSSASLFQHRHLQPVTFGRFDDFIIPGVRVAEYAHAGVGGQDAFP
jgi:hypothetical protein